MDTGINRLETVSGRFYFQKTFCVSMHLLTGCNSCKMHAGDREICHAGKVVF